MELNLDADAINKFVTDAILKSALGEKIKKSVDEVLKDFEYSYKNPVRELITDMIRIQIKGYMETPEVSAKIKEHIANKFTSEFIDEVLKKSVENAIKYVKSDNSY